MDKAFANYFDQFAGGKNFSSISIIVQVRINVQAGIFCNINKCADSNKHVQAGIIQKINKLCSTIIQETRVTLFLILSKIYALKI